MMAQLDSLPTYVISLSSEEDRMAYGHTALTDAGIPYTRIAAVDGRGKPASSFPEYDPEYTRRFMGRDLSGPEVGCYLSHLRCAEEFLKSQAKYCVVFEDDALPDPTASKVLAEVIAFLEQDRLHRVDLVNLGRGAGYLVKALDLSGGIQLQQTFHFPVTTTGILWTREGAKSFLETGRRIHAPVDHALRRFCCRRGSGLALREPLCRPSGAQSTIGYKSIAAKGASGPARKVTLREALRLGLSEARRELPNYFWSLRWYFGATRS